MKDLIENRSPIFSRVHVNDREEIKGPKAPPRNKMGLFDHQRFGSVLPSSNNTGSSCSSTSFFSSSPHGISYKRHLLTPLHHQEVPSGKDFERVPNHLNLRSLHDTQKEMAGTGNEDIEFIDKATKKGVEFDKWDRRDDVSESTSLSGYCVVGIIGEDQFHKARKAIDNQQRIFAQQVFELHRLIKVQKLMARSPNLLLDQNISTNKPDLNFPADVVERRPKDDSQTSQNANFPLPSLDTKQSKLASNMRNQLLAYPQMCLPTTIFTAPSCIPFLGSGRFLHMSFAVPGSRQACLPAYGMPVLNFSSVVEQIEEGSVLPLFPTEPIPTRAIKVVPHQPGLASESTARIFLSIQRERKR